MYVMVVHPLKLYIYSEQIIFLFLKWVQENII